MTLLSELALGKQEFTDSATTHPLQAVGKGVLNFDRGCYFLVLTHFCINLKHIALKRQKEVRN